MVRDIFLVLIQWLGYFLLYAVISIPVIILLNNALKEYIKDDK